MADRTLLITHRADEERRAAVAAALPEGYEARYLEDLDEADQPAAVAAADALLTFVPDRELTEEGFEALGDDHVIQSVTAGVDHVDLDAFPAGATLLSNAGAYAGPMAEHVLAMYLALAKRLLIEHRNLEAGEWNQFEPNLEVDGSTCAIVGFGAVGEASAELLERLGVEVLAINRSGESERDPAFLGTPDDLEHVLRRCDGAVLCAPLTPETEGMIDAAALGWMADDAFVINVGRGELIDQGDLYEHLRAHPEFQAGIEAWWTEPVRHGEFALEYPLLELPNVLGCPHNSSQVPGIGARGARAAVESAVAALEGRETEQEIDRQAGY